MIMTVIAQSYVELQHFIEYCQQLLVGLVSLESLDLDGKGVVPLN